MNSCCRNKLFAAAVGFGLAACDVATAPESNTGSTALCAAPHTPITTIQGNQYASPLNGQQATTRGVVTRVVTGAGLYLEDTEGEVKRNQSRALFVADERLSTTLSPGQAVAVTGEVSEVGDGRDTLTSVVELVEWGLCGNAVELPVTEVRLPLRPRQREALEGMRIRGNQVLVVTDVYRLDDGRIRLSLDGPLQKPTDVVTPGRSSARLFSRNLERSIDVQLADPPGFPVMVGATSGTWSGVNGHDGRYPLLHVDSLDIQPVTAPEPPARPGGGTLRLVNANLENFFNGQGDGSGFPGERGPDSHAAYQAKADRIAAALHALQPDLLAVQELENDGFGPGSAAADLLALLEAATGATWQAVRPTTDRVGSDVIRVGIFYRPDRVVTEGPAHLLDSAPFRDLSRQPLTQQFGVVGSDERFWLSVNHLKSKGRCPESGPDASRRDGQGCWNQARVASVESLMPWLGELSAQSGVDHVLVTGDMNAYRKEDPLQAFRAAGLTDLVLSHQGRESYSYVYRGERGTLDYALASPGLVEKVVNARVWNVNAAWPRGDESLPAWLRWSDHDPVVVDLDFSQ